MAAESARVAQRCEEAKTTCKLNLEDCDLRKIPDAIYFLMRGVDLQEAILAKNQLTIVPSKFGLKLPTLTSLNLSFNKLTKLPMELGNLLQLQFLDISNNSFSECPSVVGHLAALQSLNLSHNQLQLMPLEITCSDTLIRIDLSYNCFKTLVDGKCFPGARELDLSHNQIEDVEAGEVDVCTGGAAWLESIDLTHNPLKDETRSYLQSIIRVKVIVD